MYVKYVKAFNVLNEEWMRKNPTVSTNYIHSELREGKSIYSHE